MHRGREGVVRALRLVDMVVRMKELFPGDFVSAIGDDFVYIHVRLRSASCLKNHQRKIPLQLSLCNLIADTAD